MSSNGHSPSLAPQELSATSAPHKEKSAAEIVEADRWYGTLSGYVDHAHTNKSDLSLMIIDIDSLKAANDELGHDAGNELIDTVNRIITESVRNGPTSNYPERKSDIIKRTENKQAQDLGKILPDIELPEVQYARIGGDEFSIIMPDTDREGANALAERLREAIATELNLPQKQRLAKVGAGISIGVSTLEPGMEAKNLLETADKGMYRNKLAQMRGLSEDELEAFHIAVAHLEKAGVRPRDVPKYIQRFGASAVAHAMQAHEERVASGQMTLIPEATDKQQLA